MLDLAIGIECFFINRYAPTGTAVVLAFRADTAEAADVTWQQRWEGTGKVEDAHDWGRESD